MFCEVKCSFNLRWNVSRLRELGIPVPFLHLTNTKKKVFCFSNTADRLSFRLWFLVFFFLARPWRLIHSSLNNTGGCKIKLCLLSLSAKTNVFKRSIRRSVMVRRGNAAVSFDRMAADRWVTSLSVLWALSRRLTAIQHDTTALTD